VVQFRGEQAEEAEGKIIIFFKFRSGNMILTLEIISNKGVTLNAQKLKRFTKNINFFKTSHLVDRWSIFPLTSLPFFKNPITLEPS
jgi:hypothetical protein